MDLIIFSSCLVTYYALHSVLADNRIKEPLQKIIPKRFYRIFFNLISVVLLVGLVLYFNKLAIDLLFEAMPGVGIGFMSLGGILMIWALMQYDLSEFAGIYQMNHKGESPQQSLNQKGLNQLIRHPLYTANFLLFIGFLLYYPASKSLVVVVISSLYLIIGTRLEEQKLVFFFWGDLSEVSTRGGAVFAEVVGMTLKMF